MKPESLTFIHDTQNESYEPHIDESFFARESLYINGNPDYCFNDYHLPVEYLLQKYFPTIQISYGKYTELGDGQRAIYKITFRYLMDALIKQKESILDFIPKAIRENPKVLLLFNDAQEFAYYNSIDKSLWKSFVERVYAEQISERLLLVSGNKGNDGLEIATGKTRIWPLDYFFKNKLYPVQGYRYFEEVVSFQKKTHYPAYSYAEKLHALDAEDVRLFLHLNRVVKDFRTLSVYLLWKNKLLDYGYVSHSAVTEENRNMLSRSTFPEFKSADFAPFLQSLPMVLDTEAFLVNQWDNIPFHFVNKSFLWLVSETLFDKDQIIQSGFMTEKTYKPISLFMPFIIMGNPFMLKRLRNDGYKTFSEWWDESYDEEVEPAKRMQKIIKLVSSLKSLSQKQMKDMYISMKDVVEHNAATLAQTRQGKRFAETVLEKYSSL